MKAVSDSTDAAKGSSEKIDPLAEGSCSSGGCLVYCSKRFFLINNVG